MAKEGEGRRASAVGMTPGEGCSSAPSSSKRALHQSSHHVKWQPEPNACAHIGLKLSSKTPLMGGGAGLLRNAGARTSGEEPPLRKPGARTDFGTKCLTPSGRVWVREAEIRAGTGFLKQPSPNCRTGTDLSKQPSRAAA